MIYRRNGLSRHNQNMHGSLRIDVAKCDHFLILVHNIGRDLPVGDLLEDGFFVTHPQRQYDLLFESNMRQTVPRLTRGERPLTARVCSSELSRKAVASHAAGLRDAQGALSRRAPTPSDRKRTRLHSTH